MNAGAAVARGEVLLFLHADTLLPAGSVPAVLGALQDPAVIGGAFRVRLAASPGAGRYVRATLGITGRMIGARGAVSRSYSGDQAIFLRAEAFRAVRRLPGDPADGGRRAVAADAAGGKDGPAAAARGNVGTALGGVGPPPDRPVHVAPPDRLPPREDAVAMRRSVPSRTGPQAPGTAASHVIRRGVRAFARSGCRGRTRAANPYRPLPAHGISTR